MVVSVRRGEQSLEDAWVPKYDLSHLGDIPGELSPEQSLA